MIFPCLETCYCWHKKVSSPLSLLAESILTWHLSIHLVTPPKEPCIPATLICLMFRKDILFQTSMPFFLCWKYPSPFLIQIIQKIHSSSMYESHWWWKQSWEFGNTHSLPAHFSHYLTHKHIHHKPKKLGEQRNSGENLSNPWTNWYMNLPLNILAM